MVQTSLNTGEQALLEAVDADRLMASTRAIAQWERLCGSEDEAKAFDWIESRLREYGLEPVRLSHPALVSWPESAELTITKADGSTETIPCATHAFAVSTPENGLTARLVDAGGGSDRANAAEHAGQIVIFDGIIAPNHNLRVEAAGVAGSIWIAGSRLHERALSPVWGTPTPETGHLLPQTSSISVTQENGQRIRDAMSGGPVSVTMKTSVFRDWLDLPLVTADVKPTSGSAEANTFVMLSGHVDSWYYGAMDNGTANATQLEVGRILAGRSNELARGLRLAFWSGHSQARYAGSAWYADEYWQELREHCVAHINVDSVGAKGATVLSEGNNMPELREFVSAAIEPLAGQRLSRRRFGRSGDQSFWGVGMPSALMSLSEQPPENADPVLLALHNQISGGKSRSGGLGSWWHTPDDTVDKIDPELLRRDAQIYTLLLHRFCTVPVLPFDFRVTLDELSERIEQLQEQASGRFDFSSITSALADARTALTDFYKRVDALSEAGTSASQNRVDVNRALMAVARALIPVDYTVSGEFDHDLAMPTTPLPGLSAVAELSDLDPQSDAYHFLHTRLRRQRNRVVHALRQINNCVGD